MWRLGRLSGSARDFYVEPEVGPFDRRDILRLHFLQNKAGEEGFTLPNTRGTASVTGSFAGKNHGSLSRVTVYTNLTIARFRTVCESKAGLTGYKIISGTAKFS